MANQGRNHVIDEANIGKCIDYKVRIIPRIRHVAERTEVRIGWKIVGIGRGEWAFDKTYKVKSNFGNGNEEYNIDNQYDIIRVYDCPPQQQMVVNGANNMQQVEQLEGVEGKNRNNENMEGGKRKTRKTRKQRKSRKTRKHRKNRKY